MVTKEELEESITRLNETLTTNFKKLLTDSIDELKNTIIDNLKKSNELLQIKVKSLESEILVIKNDQIELTKRSGASFQHARLEQIIISGIPENVSHEELEGKSIVILNQIKNHHVTSRDVAACHRVGKKHDTILRFVNRKDAEDSLENSKKLENIDREAVGLDPDAKIYINANLSPFMSKLAYYCRALKRKNLVNKVTTFKGIVKITRSVGTRNVSNVIGHKKDLENIFPNLDELLV